MTEQTVFTETDDEYGSKYILAKAILKRAWS